MPYCIAKYCKVSDRNNPKKAHFHRMPSTKKRPLVAWQWLAKCARPPRKDPQARVCSHHFVYPDDYENAMKYEAGFTKTLLLKPDAVPSIFKDPIVAGIVEVRNGGVLETRRARRRTASGNVTVTSNSDCARGSGSVDKRATKATQSQGLTGAKKRRFRSEDPARKRGDMEDTAIKDVSFKVEDITVKIEPSDDFFPCEFCSDPSSNCQGADHVELVPKTEDVSENEDVTLMGHEALTFLDDEQADPIDHEELENKLLMQGSKRSHYCQVCHTEFLSKAHLTRHLRSHSGERPYQCLICGAAFAQKGSAVKHQRTHTGERPFRCPLCSSAFAQHSHLGYHMLSHSGAKPFQCDICQSRFSRRSSLKYHQRIHNGDKAFHCPDCHYKFTRQTDLTRHSRTHTGERPFKCQVCETTFTRAGHLKKHEKSHNGVDVKQRHGLKDS